MPNVFSHPYHESISNFRVVGGGGGVFFIFIQILKETCVKQIVENLIRHDGLHV